MKLLDTTTRAGSPVSTQASLDALGFVWAYFGTAAYSTFTGVGTAGKAPTVGGSVRSYTLPAGTYLVQTRFSAVAAAYFQSSASVGLYFSAAPSSTAVDAIPASIVVSASSGVITCTQASALGLAETRGYGPQLYVDFASNTFSGPIAATLLSWQFTLSAATTVTPATWNFLSGDTIFSAIVDVRRVY